MHLIGFLACVQNSMSESQRAQARGTEHDSLEFEFALITIRQLFGAFRSNGGISHALPGELLHSSTRQVGKFYFPLGSTRRGERYTHRM